MGCTLYAAAYGQNPFEASVNEMGGSIALAILNGYYKFPLDKEEQGHYSDEFENLIKFLLVIDPKERPDIQAVSVKWWRKIKVLNHALYKLGNYKNRSNVINCFFFFL